MNREPDRPDLDEAKPRQTYQAPEIFEAGLARNLMRGMGGMAWDGRDNFYAQSRIARGGKVRGAQKR